MTRILYCNVNRSRAAHDMLKVTARDEGADVILCSEPNKIRVSTEGWMRDPNSDTAISGTAAINASGSRNGFSWARLESLTVSS